MKFNGHLFTGASAENPFSFKTDAVPIDPNRGRVLPSNVKKFDDTTVVYTTDQPGMADRMQQVRGVFLCFLLFPACPGMGVDNRERSSAWRRSVAVSAMSCSLLLVTTIAPVSR
jgi:hypothetical protein